MKKKQPQKPFSEHGSLAAKKVKTMTLLLRISFILCVIATLCLFAGIADFGIINLTSLLSKYNAAFLVLQLLTSLSCALTISQISAANKEIILQQSESLNEKIEGRIDIVDDKVQEYLGENYKKLKEQNESMKTEFDQIRENANIKITAEIEELKMENADLRKKLDDKNSAKEEVIEPENQLQVA